MTADYAELAYRDSRADPAPATSGPQGPESVDEIIASLRGDSMEEKTTTKSTTKSPRVSEASTMVTLRYGESALRNGKDVAQLTLNGGPVVPFVNLMAHPAGLVGMFLVDENEKVRSSLTVDEHDDAKLELSDEDGKTRAILGACTLVEPPTAKHTVRTESSLALFDRDGHVIYRAP